MIRNLKFCEHESVEWVVKKLPKLKKSIFNKNVKINVTSFDVNDDIVVLGTNTGYLSFINRKDNSVENILLKDAAICKIQIKQTIELSVASGFECGSLFILKIPIKEKFVFIKANQFNVPTDHSSTIKCITWSKNAEKLFTGDCNGNICCTEVNNMDRTVSSYLVFNSPSPVVHLSYSYKCLVISTENQNLIYNFTTNSTFPIGTKSRTHGQYGACFTDKLCHSEDVEIVVARPDSKFWISKLNGVVQRTILLKSEAIFSLDKSIGLLPCLTSQSNKDYIDEIQKGTIKYQLGLVDSINENEVLFWSKNGLIIFDISTGRIVSSTCNLGIILSVSICHNLISNESVFSLFPESKNANQDVLEIWILRKPISDDDSTLVRLSTLPLYTSKLVIDPFYYFSEYQDFKQHNPLSDNISEHVLPQKIQSEEVPITGKTPEHWLPNVTDKLQELTKLKQHILNKSHEILEKGNEIFENANEGIEQALELTEEGVIIKNNEEEVLPPKNYIPITNPSIKIKVHEIVSNGSIVKHHRKNVQNRTIIDIGSDSNENETFECTTKISDDTIDPQTSADVIDETFECTTKISDDTIDPQTSTDVIVEYDEPWNLNEELCNSLKGEKIPTISDGKSFPELCTDSFSKSDVSSKDIYENELSHTETKSVKIDSPVDNQSDNISYPFSIEIHDVEDHSPSAITQDQPKNESQISVMMEDKLILTNAILMRCNKWISHRGPTLSGNNKITSLSVNRRMIWITDTKGSVYLRFRNSDERLNNTGEKSSDNKNELWLQDSLLHSEKIFSSPEGVILWCEKSGDISVYTGMTRIWTPRVVKEKVLLKSNWEQIMSGIKEVDIDNDMAVVVTRRGELQLILDISGGGSYNKCTPSLTGHVILATTFNGIIWCVTEIMDPYSKTHSQHIFSCSAKDEDGNLNVSYWRTVPIPSDIVVEKEEHLGTLGGSLAIKCIQLGTNGLAWILTFQNLCFFSKNVSIEKSTGDGIWYQISLHFLSQISTDESVGFGFDWTRVEKIFRYPESRDKRTNSNTLLSSLLISTKADTKRSFGNGFIWVTCADKISPCILFESDKDLLGHGWLDCFANAIKKKTIASLPSILAWSSVTVGFKNVLWLLSNSNEIFYYWKETRFRNIAVQQSFGKIIQISAQNTTVLLLTNKSLVCVRMGIACDNPIGTDWKVINFIGNSNKETIKDVSCFDNEIWILTMDNVFYYEDLRSLTHSTSKKFHWHSLNDSITNTFSMIQIIFKELSRKYIWAISDSDGYVYLGEWSESKKSFQWIYIPSPRAKKLHVTDENVWMIEQFSGEIYVRCGIDWQKKPTGDYWIHIPVSTTPITCLSASKNNNVAVIDCKKRLLLHYWSVVESNVTRHISECSLMSKEMCKTKSADGDWELLI